MSLIRIQKTTQEVADAIAAVLGVDVSIVDENLFRVASTGRNKNKIGERLPANCAFEKIKDNKRSVYINDPNFSDKCLGCSINGKCDEMATMGYPILNGDELIGVIGITAYDLVQKERMHDSYKSLLVFLEKLGGLLSESLNNLKVINMLTMQDRVTQMMINVFSSGVIFTNRNGKIKIINSKVEQYLEMPEKEILQKNIKDILPNIKLDNRYDFFDERKVDINGVKRSIMFKNVPVVMGDTKICNIVEINRTSNMVKDAYMLIEGKNSINFDEIFGKSPKIVAVKELAQSVAKSESTVIIRGDSGTGKEMFARAIHNNSDRSQFPYIAINCASIPDNLLESELFGYEEGAFTGAKKEGQIGKFELAHGGTLFLDEIGDLPLHLQPKILRALQEKSFRRVGGKEVISLDFRLITATNRNLEKMIQENKFREDLYYRLNVIPVHIPPLKERKDDIGLLSKHFLKIHCIKLGVEQKLFSVSAQEALNTYDWPGNIRELENVIEYLVNIVKGETIEYKDLPSNIQEFCLNLRKRRRQTVSLKDMVDNYEREILEGHLNRYGTTKKEKEHIAKLLDIDISTLYRKLSKYNLQ